MMCINFSSTPSLSFFSKFAKLALLELLVFLVWIEIREEFPVGILLRDPGSAYSMNCQYLSHIFKPFIVPFDLH
jgi:hypothetical protein